MGRAWRSAEDVLQSGTVNISSVWQDLLFPRPVQGFLSACAALTAASGCRGLQKPLAMQCIQPLASTTA